MMSDGAQPGPDTLERFRDYLSMIARAQIGPKYRAKIDAEALVNGVLFEAHQQWDRIRGDSETELRAWLRRVLSNGVNDAIRFHHRDRRDVDREQQPAAASDWEQSCCRFVDVTCGLTSPSMRVVRQERELQVARALAQLPDDQRDAIELHHLHGCSLAETAETMDRTVASVVGLLRRGLKQLKGILQTIETGNS